MPGCVCRVLPNNCLLSAIRSMYNLLLSNPNHESDRTLRSGTLQDIKQPQQTSRLLNVSRCSFLLLLPPLSPNLLLQATLQQPLCCPEACPEALKPCCLQRFGGPEVRHFVRFSVHPCAETLVQTDTHTHTETRAHRQRAVWHSVVTSATEHVLAYSCSRDYP